jgi:hypothetical protein
VDADVRLPPTHSVIPALTQIDFKNVSEYLEILVARIDAPLLNRLEVTFSPSFLTAQFIGRAPSL